MEDGDEGILDLVKQLVYAAPWMENESRAYDEVVQAAANNDPVCLALVRTVGKARLRRMLPWHEGEKDAGRSARGLNDSIEELFDEMAKVLGHTDFEELEGTMAEAARITVESARTAVAEALDAVPESERDESWAKQGAWRFVEIYSAAVIAANSREQAVHRPNPAQAHEALELLSGIWRGTGREGLKDVETALEGKLNKDPGPAEKEWNARALRAVAKALIGEIYAAHTGTDAQTQFEYDLDNGERLAEAITRVMHQAEVEEGLSWSRMRQENDGGRSEKNPVWRYLGAKERDAVLVEGIVQGEMHEAMWLANWIGGIKEGTWLDAEQRKHIAKEIVLARTWRHAEARNKETPGDPRQGEKGVGGAAVVVRRAVARCLGKGIQGSRRMVGGEAVRQENDGRDLALNRSRGGKKVGNADDAVRVPGVDEGMEGELFTRLTWGKMKKVLSGAGDDARVLVEVNDPDDPSRTIRRRLCVVDIGIDAEEAIVLDAADGETQPRDTHESGKT